MNSDELKAMAERYINNRNVTYDNEISQLQGSIEDQMGKLFLLETVAGGDINTFKRIMIQLSKNIKNRQNLLSEKERFNEIHDQNNVEMIFDKLNNIVNDDEKIKNFEYELKQPERTPSKNPWLTD